MSGKDVFELYDTYGFPLDLTKLMAKEQGWEIDEKGFESELTIQKNRSRNATKIDTEDWIEVQDSATHSEFIGYTQFESAVRILRYRYVKSKNGNYYQLVLNRTPFYAESGGQVGDTGALSSENGVIKIDNTVKENDTIIHVTNAVLDNMQLEFHAAIDMHKRSLTAKNHSATHLLQSALRKVLGDHVQQKGSLVNEKYLRFDFAHFAKMKDEEIKQVEELVNEKIGLEIQCRIEEHIELEEAKKRGVTALFGEKYGDFVRIVTFDEQYSMELCGGTHVKNTGELGFFKILSESSIASGIRRIEATTSQNVIDYYREKELALMNISNLLKNPNNIITSIQNLQTENSNLKKNLQNFESYIIQNEVSRMVAKYGPSKETMILEELTGINAEVAKSICSQLRIHYPSKLIMIAVREDKLKLSIGCGDDFIAGANMDAKSIVKEISAHIQGGGGGQSTLASFVGEPTGDLDNLRAKLLTIIPAK
jgi:alanyl-tRNA synthetase